MDFIVALLITPLIALAGAFLRALVLFWPVMIVLGMIHPLIPAIPALGWSACFLLVALLSLLIPTGGSND